MRRRGPGARVAGGRGRGWQRRPGSLGGGLAGLCWLRGGLPFHSTSTSARGAGGGEGRALPLGPGHQAPQRQSWLALCDISPGRGRSQLWTPGLHRRPSLGGRWGCQLSPGGRGRTSHRSRARWATGQGSGRGVRAPGVCPLSPTAGWLAWSEGTGRDGVGAAVHSACAP